MTFNAEFLWDGVQPEEGSSEVTFPWKRNKEKAQVHMKNVAEVIKRHNPDIVNLVEVEGKKALNKFYEKFLPGQGYKAYLVKGKDTHTCQDVGQLTRIGPEDGKIKRSKKEGQSGGQTRGVTKHYVARFKADGQKLALVGLHFLSNPGASHKLHRRQAQAHAIRKMAADVQRQGYLPIVLGGFND